MTKVNTRACADTPPRASARMRALFAVFVAVLLALSLSGCKYTDVLTEHVEDPENGEVDPNVEPLYKNVPDAQLIPELANTVIAQDYDEDTQAEVLPHYDPDAPDNGPTPQLRYDEETPEDEEASEGEEESSATDTSNGEGSSEGESEGEEKSDQEDDMGDSDELASADGGAGGTTVIVDDQGTNSDTLPRGTIAAVGEYATITEMLGGSGGLVAADESWLSTMKSQGVFPESGNYDNLDNVKVAWSGDGTAAGQTNVDALVNDIRPSVILWDGQAPALSDSDRAQLEAAGIQIQPVPTLGEYTTEDANIRQAVTEVAGVLSGATGLALSPTDMRDNYLKFHDETLRNCYVANGSKYAFKATDQGDGKSPHLYQVSPLSGFDDPGSSETACVYVDRMQGLGSAATVNQHTLTTDGGTISLPHDGQSLDASDGVALSTYSASDSYMLLDYYLQLGGIVNNAYEYDKPQATGKPYIIMAGSTSSFGSSGNFTSRGSGVDSGLWWCNGDQSGSGNWVYLSDTGEHGISFPAVLVNGEEGTAAAEAIARSSSKSNGLYNIGKGNTYGIYVVPVGVSGSWAKGNVESFLVGLWALRMRNAAIFDVAATSTASFYSTFYRVDDWKNLIPTWDVSYTGS